MLRLARIILVIALLAPACDSPSPSGERRAATAGAAAGDAACPNQQRALEAERPPRARRLAADVDGDGTRDEVWITVTRRAPAGCQAFVIADTAEDAALVAPLAAFDARAAGPGLPRLSGAHAIDGRPGAEVVVDVAAGASTVFASVLTVADGELVRVDVRGRGAPARDLFAYGGGVTHAYGIDCRRAGAVVVVEAVARGARFEVERTLLRAGGVTWKVERRRRTVVTARRLLARYPALGAPPFLGCPPA